MPTLDAVIEQAMELPYETRLHALDAIRKRTVEEALERLAQEAAQAQRDFHAGKLEEGDVQEFMRRLDDVQE